MSATPADVTVSSAVATAVATKCHLFKIYGYKRIKTMYGNGKSIDSCRFEAAGRTWRILFFPDGNQRNSMGHASLFLKLDDADADADSVLVEFKFSLVCHHGKQGPQPQSGTLTATFSNKGSGKVWGYCQFMKRKDLEKSRFLRDDHLAIRCDMVVFNNPVDVKELAAQEHDLQNLGVACHCKDDACKSYHRRGAFSFTDVFIKLFLGCFHV